MGRTETKDWVRLNDMANKEVLHAIDKEIARLQQAREMLVGEGETVPAGKGDLTPGKRGPGRPAGTKRTLSSEARKRIAEGQKKRWAAKKSAE